MFKFMKRVWNREDGAILAYVAILMPIFIGFIALGLDVASWHLDKRRTQTIADAGATAAALAAFRLIQEDETASDNDIETAAEAAALNAALLNNYDPAAGDTFVFNRPPTAGQFAGDDSAIEVIVRSPLPLLLSSLVITGTGSAASRAVALGDGGNSCLFALNETASGAISVAGGSEVNLGCGVFSNSNDSDAIKLSGTDSCIDATEILTVGGTAGDCFTPTPETSAAPQADPLANLPEPAFSGCDFNNNFVISGSQDHTFSPGVYCGKININSTGNVTFQPGQYIFDGAGLTIGAGANVTGNDVFFFLSENTKTNDNININSGATVNFDAPDSGVYQDIFLFQSRAAPENINHNFTGGSNMNIDGIIYTPNQDVNFHGGSASDESNTFIIADEISITGQSFLNNTDPSGTLLTFNPFLVKANLVE